MGKVNGLGLVNEEILVKEYLRVIEYVVDSVSRDGYHKIIALWEYDRRPTNGAQFVLHGQRLMTSNEEASKLLIPYIRSVLDALQIRNGPGHAEVKIHNGEAVLVEIGSRCHGGEGLWCIVEDECYGYNQAVVAVDSYLNGEAFVRYPDEPSEIKASGRIKYLVSHITGKLQCLNDENIKEIASMESFRGKDIFVDPGQIIKPTIDCFTWAGAIQMVHKSEEHMLRDYARIEEIENDNLFILQSEELPRENCVCIVDPFSTGAVVASNVNKRNLRCVCIYSSYLDVFEGINNFIPHGLQVTFDEVVKTNLQQGPNRVENENKYADDIIEQLKRLPWNILSIVAGCETGVELTDRLCKRLDLRRNGDMNSDGRRNKYLMGEAIRSAGVRAVKQKCIESISEVDTFYQMYNTTDDNLIFPVIVKPVESAGSDSVTKCVNREQLVNTVEKILQSKNQLGKQNSSVLLQEFLDGIEFVVDCVSRDGIHKVVALWQYDKRPINGADFVYFGQWLLDANDPQYAPLINYQKSVLDALGIINGPSHGEVKLCRGEPVEVEVGARCHGAEGAWCDLENAVYGANQAELALDAYLGDGEAFNQIPDLCIHQGKYGVLVILVSYVEGELIEINEAFMQEIRNMPSFRGMELFVHKGEVMHKTIDCFTFAGNVKLIHDDMDAIRSHYERIREIELSGLFQVREINEEDY
jgi:biotin carboxylase